MRKAKLSDLICLNATDFQTFSFSSSFFKNPPPKKKLLEHKAAKSLPESLRHAAETRGCKSVLAQRKKNPTKKWLYGDKSEDVAFEEERIIFEEKD